MNRYLKQYFISLGSFSVFVVLLTVVFFYFFPQWYLPSTPFALLFFVVLHAFLNGWTIQVAQKKTTRFSHQFMLMTTIKFLVLLMTLTIWLFLISQKLIFGINFLGFFFLFLIFETVILYKISMKISNR
jgi:heme A synthase